MAGRERNYVMIAGGVQHYVASRVKALKIVHDLGISSGVLCDDRTGSILFFLDLGARGRPFWADAVTGAAPDRGICRNPWLAVARWWGNPVVRPRRVLTLTGLRACSVR